MSGILQRLRGESFAIAIDIACLDLGLMARIAASLPFKNRGFSDEGILKFASGEAVAEGGARKLMSGGHHVLGMVPCSSMGEQFI